MPENAHVDAENRRRALLSAAPSQNHTGEKPQTFFLALCEPWQQYFKRLTENTRLEFRTAGVQKFAIFSLQDFSFHHKGTRAWEPFFSLLWRQRRAKRRTNARWQVRAFTAGHFSAFFVQ